jgi:UDP-N-acetylglucosamine--N-acetylmuramyl-(pentapeptide) pyrophosphoryl-undecaprenol N-acetylglucosamine transferase
MSSTGTVIFAGGGTGGHLYPGFALAHALQQARTGIRCLFVGSERSIESSLFASQPFPRLSIPIEPLAAMRRQPFRFLVGNTRALWAARELLLQEHPQLVVGLGGYVSVPCVWWASRQKIPTALIEQNAIPGRATRWLAAKASLIAATFEEVTQSLPAKSSVMLLGTPVRDSIQRLYRQPVPQGEGPLIDHQQPLRLLVLGGSQGAESLNDVVLAWLRTSEYAAQLQVTHQTGTKDHQRMLAAYSQSSLSVIAKPFIEDMAGAYAAHDLVISRAGATTLAELAIVGLPAVLLPYPHAADQHQRANAKAVEQQGAAIMVEHHYRVQQTAEKLARAIHPLLANRHSLTSMAVAQRNRAYPDATPAIAERLLELIDSQLSAGVTRLPGNNR